MRKSRFTETQIVSISKEADGGMPVNEVIAQARRQPADGLQGEGEVRRDGRVGFEAGPAAHFRLRDSFQLVTS
jgi:hypothetical protein